jgi:hypothetical protein
MEKTGKVISAIFVGAALLGAGALAGAQMFPTEIAKEVPVEKIVTVEKTIYVDKPVEVIKEVPTTITEFKEVDNGNLDLVMSFVEDNFDEDISVGYIVFETDAKVEAEAYIRSNLITLLSDNDFFDDGAVFDPYRKSEVSLTKIYDAEVFDRDYDNQDLTLQYQVKVKAKESGEDSVYKVFDVTLPFEDGKLIEDDIEINLVE